MTAQPVDREPTGAARPEHVAAARQARCLLRAARSGCLATAANAQPFASLVTPACMPDGALLLLLSQLAEHTRHLMVYPRCSLMVTGIPATANPQTTPRITINGVAEVVAGHALKARYLAIHPYAALYADFGDFATWRIAPTSGILVGGFARAFRLTAADLVPEADAQAAILAAEPAILTRCNHEYADTLAALAGEPGDWRMVTVDADGFDLALADRVIRIAWSEPLKDAGGIHQELMRLARQGREPTDPRPAPA